MGISPSDGTRLVPVSPPAKAHLEVHWDEIIRLAEERRPELMELKLQILVDQQLLLQANNQALPKVDAVALYRFNGLAGTTPTGAHLASEPGQFTDYSLGLNVSLPLYLRSARALLRQQQLTLARDRAGLDQGLHAAIHDLATSTRTLAQDYEQFISLTAAREAAEVNLKVQAALAKTGKVIYLNVLQAITDWGNTVSAQAQALALYNTDLANLEKQSGTILETHGIHFFEERYPSIGPCGRLFKPRSYPESTPPGPNVNRYPTGSKPAENTFDLRAPIPTPSSPSSGAPEPQGNGVKLGPVSALE
jgi:outer membrane protein TolC